MTRQEIEKQIALLEETIRAVRKLEQDSPVTEPMFADIIKLRTKMISDAQAKLGKLKRVLAEMNKEQNV